jgi:hypothetical protein
MQMTIAKCGTVDGRCVVFQRGRNLLRTFRRLLLFLMNRRGQ